MWTGFDYIGEPAPEPWPARSSYFGVLDLCGTVRHGQAIFQKMLSIFIKVNGQMSRCFIYFRTGIGRAKKG